MAAEAIVSVKAGQLQGVNQKGIFVFKGVPFAAPPVGEGRWRPPQPVEPWIGVRLATKFSPTAYQRATGIEKFIDGLVNGQGWGFARREGVKLLLKVAPKPKASEDCLYLNVRTPTLDSEARLPVMVWIHGGDHQDGAGSEIFYDSNGLAEQGVVAVTINYRLGLMGYFAHPELMAESAQGVAGNYGTLDQIAALRWVQENIAAFGGDPDNVTIFGESAGGESVIHMLTSPLARGLFHKAIAQSAANAGQMIHLKRPFLTHPAAIQSSLAFAAKAGVTGRNQLAQLRQLSADALYKTVRQNEEMGSFYPVIDGYVLPTSPFVAFQHGQQAHVPLLIGSNADEATLLYPMIASPLPEYYQQPLPANEMPAFMHEAFGADLAELVQLYPGLERRSLQSEIDFLGDLMFGARARFYAECAAQQGQPAFLYFFTRVPPSPTQTAGAFHAAELSFVHGSSNPVLPLNAADLALSATMMGYWTQFARTGDPNGGKRPQWELFDPAEPGWMVLDVDKVGYEPVARERKYGLLNGRLHRQIAAMEARDLEIGD
ncbi:MAG: carboxylesterase family protein [Anaerolineales bacterium]|nr:carboxylesterase family protein [Anaerolineales bacterium]